MSEQYYVTIGGTSFNISLSDRKVFVGSEEHAVDATVLPGGYISLLIDNRHFVIRMNSPAGEEGGEGKAFMLEMGSAAEEVLVDTNRTRLMKSVRQAGGRGRDKTELLAPMPGLVSKVLVTSREHVRKGHGLLILEAMKMENEIKAPSDGDIREIKVKAGSTVDKGEILIVMDPS